MGENIKDKVSLQFVFIETVKKKLLKIPALLIDIVYIKNVQDKLFNNTIDDQEKNMKITLAENYVKEQQGRTVKILGSYLKNSFQTYKLTHSTIESVGQADYLTGSFFMS